jgi:hypothetical protein
MRHTWRHISTTSSSSRTFWQVQQQQRVTSQCSGALVGLELSVQAQRALQRTLSSSSRVRSFPTAHSRQSVC